MAYTGSTAAILSNYDEALKTFYLPAIQDQLNNENFLSSVLETNERDVSGKNATIECHYGRTNATGSRADGGALPDADYQKFQTAIVPMRYNYARVTFSGPTIAATRDERGSYARVVDTEIRGAMTDLRKECNRQMWGAGGGTLARWRSTGSGTSYTLQKKYRANSAGGDGFGSTFGAKYLKENNSAVPAVLTTSTGVTDITVDTTNIAVSVVTEASDGTYDTITCTDPSVTEAAGTFYVRPGNLVSVTSGSAAGAARLEMMGLRGIVTDTDIDDIYATDGGTSVGFKASGAPANDPLQGLAVGTYSWWKAQVSSHTSGRYGGQRALTLPLMQKQFDDVEIAAGRNVGPDLIISSHAMRREYFELMEARQRDVNTMELDGGWSAMDYNGVPFVVDVDGIDGEIYFLTTSKLQIYRMSDFQWMMKDGAVLQRIVGYDAYEAALYRYAELGTTRRNVHGVLADLIYTA